MSQRRSLHGTRWLLCAAAFLVASPCARAQIQPMFNHALSDQRIAGPAHPVRAASALPDTLKILVAMVEFQPDDELRTSGTGSFDLGTTTKKLIDPPPHDRAYVLNHMTFAENYFRKVSDGKQILAVTVLDNTYRVPRKLQDYSPPRTSTTNAELGLLVNDAWHLIDSSTPGIAFSQYDAFMIVHAGIGRDVDLTSIYGYDPTPYDIPSVYVSYENLRKIYGPSYQGVPVADSLFHIRSTIIIPETEDRVIETVSGTATLELGINGLIVASIGSHLGLPDLFNTKNGRSAIGRFGLMDGQSIFSWSGVFPPEPSAWEKYFLGWVTPITVPPGSNIYDLPAVSRSGSEDSIYRVPISAKEYFLVENRNRDANRDGARLTIVQGDSTVQRFWARDTAAGFNAFDQDSLYGVVTDVDEFDWSLPGGVNTRTGEWYEGGILIWHIDENIIEANYAADAVNANPDRRGVDLEEADGSQDIGQSYGFISAGAGSEDGTPFDFWYKGNPSTIRLISNEFSPASHPNSLSNDLANSHVTIKGFSLRGPVMQATIEFGDEQVSMLPGFPQRVSGSSVMRAVTVADLDGDALPDILFPTMRVSAGDLDTVRILGWQLNGTPILGAPGGVLVEGADTSLPNMGKVAAADLDRDTHMDFVTVATHDKHTIRAWTVRDTDADQRADTLFTKVIGGIAGNPVVVSDSFIVASGGGGKLYMISRNGSFGLDSLDVFSQGEIAAVAVFAEPDTFVVGSTNGEVAIVSRHTVVRTGSLPGTLGFASPAVATVSPVLGKRIVFTSGWGTPYVLDGSLQLQASGLPFVNGGIESWSSPAIADIDDDGQKDIIVFLWNRIYAINALGVVLNNFPISTPTDHQLLSSPIVADVDGNGTNDIVAVTQEGLVVAYDKTGKMVVGFPIQSGGNTGATPAAFYMPSACLSCTDIGLALASDDGNVYAWKTGTLSTGPGPRPQQPWPQLLHDAQNTGLDVSTPASTPCSSCGQVSNAYNWPNPVKVEDGFRTRIRYFLAADAAVTVKVFDLAGDLVAELQGQGKGGFDNEIEWDCSSIQSGIYFAHIDAQGGAAGSAVIKIAVVR